ncbi:MAG: hypothetical protein HFF13_03745 [Angelakisella sp.]|jgi:hypothetical protein|nr:hypothetical protein [Angelakisella sp.]
MNKLLKYEFRATLRLYLPLYLVMLGFAVLGRFSLWGVPWEVTVQEDLVGWTNLSVSVAGTGVGNEVLAILLNIVLAGNVLVLLGAMVVHFIITLQRFWKNLMGDEGYLMFTLPVSTGELLWSKAICAFVWGVVTALMVLLSVLVLAWHPQLVQAVKQELSTIAPEEWQLILQMLHSVLPPVMWPILVAEAVISGVGGLFLLYSAMAIGHTVKNHKVLASVGAYGVISMVLGTAASLLMNLLLPLITGIPQDIQLNSLSELLLFSYQIGRFMTGIWSVVLAIDLLSAIGGFLLARHLLNTQLNLE